MLLGVDVAYNQAAPTGNIAHEPELSFQELGLTDTVLGEGLYGHTLLVRSGSYPVESFGPEHATCHMLKPLAQATCLYRATNLSLFLSKTRCPVELVRILPKH